MLRVPLQACNLGVQSTDDLFIEGLFSLKSVVAEVIRVFLSQHVVKIRTRRFICQQPGLIENRPTDSRRPLRLWRRDT